MPSAFLSGADYLALPHDPIPWIIQDLIPVSGLTNLYGKPKSGKSFAAIGMAQAISTGQPDWMQAFTVHKHGPVAYLQIDTPRGEWSGRLRELRDDANLDLNGIYFCDMLMTKSYPFNILLPDQQAWLRAEMDILKPLVVFIDTLRELHNGDENDSTVMRNVVTALVAACRPAAIVLVSHGRKETMMSKLGGNDLMTDARGSSYVAGRMDVIAQFTKQTMEYKGRGKGEGTLKIMQNPDTGMMQLNGEDAAYQNALRGIITQMRDEDPKVSVNKLAIAIADATTHKKLRQINTDVKHYLASLARGCKSPITAIANPVEVSPDVHAQ